MDRNREQFKYVVQCRKSLSARRAWIEISDSLDSILAGVVALRKESVDRNMCRGCNCDGFRWSLSARRAWIEISQVRPMIVTSKRRSPQGERG